ncbi:putative RNA-binding protein [Venturia nashicola]|uniref:Putative RNA-binding protein n=1 Tax=Venturia nashicola TaxID=86259 RepID=A0A4Z1P4K4_9PEZI|nr:putative RNA-binding protein [Venturia nashicola]
MPFDCETCYREFTTWHGATQHMNALDHWAPTFECQICDLEFSNEHAVNQHMAAKNHFTDRWCHDCNRGFENANNYRMHRNSRLHRGATVICPFCQVGFTSASGVTHHLETASCPNARGMDRDSIYSELRRRDPNGAFTRNLIGWHGESNVQNIATDRSWNGQAFEYFLCDKEFRQLAHLNQHLSSPAHAQKYYHCPKAGCAKEFANIRAKPSQVKTKPSQASLTPSQADTKPSQADTKPSQADTKPSQADTKPSQADTKPSQANTTDTDISNLRPRPSHLRPH